MTAYGFKARFCQPIIDGTKGGTIRDDRKDGRLPPIGGALQLYTAMRTSQCRKIAPDVACLEVQRIHVDFDKGEVIFPRCDITRPGQLTRMGRLYLANQEMLTAFARFDGFQDFSEMELFWMKERGPAFRPLYDGNHIRWRDWPAALLGD